MYSMQITTFIETVNAHEEVGLTNWVTGPNFHTMFKAAEVKAREILSGHEDELIYLNVRKQGESTERNYVWAFSQDSWFDLNHHAEPAVDDH